MSLTSLLETITRRQRQRRLTKWSDYRQLVARICDGKEPDADEIAGILADNERTLEELRADAELLARRRKMRAEMDAIIPLESEADKLGKQIKDAEQAFETQTKKHEEQTSPLYLRRTEINAIRKQAARARDELRDTCADRELLTEYESVQEELNAVEHERATIADEITNRERWIRQDQDKAEATAHDSERRRYEARAETHREVLADWQAKLEPVDRVVAGLQDRMSSLEEMLLEP